MASNPFEAYLKYEVKPQHLLFYSSHTISFMYGFIHDTPRVLVSLGTRGSFLLWGICEILYYIIYHSLLVSL